MNLIQPWPILPPFDLVFMRNVMIYFDVETKKTILKRVRNCLLPHGHLFLGTAETTINLDRVPAGDLRQSGGVRPRPPRAGALSRRDRARWRPPARRRRARVPKLIARVRHS